MDKALQDLFIQQTQVIATLSLRISVLEKLLLDKKIISVAEVAKETDIFGKEFATKTQEALKRAAQLKHK
jgi:hypothetical protein